MAPGVPLCIDVGDEVLHDPRVIYYSNDVKGEDIGVAYGVGERACPGIKEHFKDSAVIGKRNLGQV